MKCKDCSVPPIYDYSENCKLCGLFGFDNNDEHFKVYGLEGSLCTNIQEQACAIGFRAVGGYVYNKVNKWHNIKENPNDLPNDGELVLANNIFTTECVKFKKDDNCWKHDKFELCNVVYWKEIVLPIELRK